MASKQLVTMIILVDNEFGVLTRLTALIRREGWNIRSLAVSMTKSTAVSKFTVCVECVDSTVLHVTERIKKLACVRSLVVYSPEKHLSRELVLVRLDSSVLERARPVLEQWQAVRIQTPQTDSLFQLTQSPENIDTFIEQLNEFGIVDMVRSGAIVLDITV